MQLYKELYKDWENKKQNPRQFNIENINRTGRYILIDETTETKNSLGTIEFSRVIYDNNKEIGAFFCKYLCRTKSWIFKIDIGKKGNGVWKIVHEEILTIW